MNERMNNSVEILDYKSLASELGCEKCITDPNVTLEEKREYLNTIIDKYSLFEANILDSKGVNLFNGVCSKERDYFIEAMHGKNYISEPILSKVTGNLNIFISAPIWNHGQVNTKIIGCIMLIPKYIEGILHEKKYTVAHKFYKNNLKVLSLGTLFCSIPSLLIGYFGTKHILIDFIMIFMISVTTVLLGINKSKILAVEISGSIGKCTRRLLKLSDGDLISEIDKNEKKDETALLTNATRNIVLTQKAVIDDLNVVFDAIANGDFTVCSKDIGIYRGDYIGILKATDRLKNKMKSSFSNIKSSIETISEGAVQVAEISQHLAGNVENQNNVVSDFEKSVSEIADSIINSTNDRKSILEKTLIAEKYAESSTFEMEQMKASMARISAVSNEISKISAEIEDLAEQTNLLSLNATIEAARAGESGKGFAVVAQEIRKLAEKSRSSVEVTKRYIEQATEEVKKGEQITSVTSNSMIAVIENTRVITNDIKKIDIQMSRQSIEIDKIRKNIHSTIISVQKTNEVAQDLSATSQELAAQSLAMNQNVAQFKI